MKVGNTECTVEERKPGDGPGIRLLYLATQYDKAIKELNDLLETVTNERANIEKLYKSLNGD